MSHSTGTIVFLIGLAVVFVTFGYLLVNARALMRLFRPVSDREIVPGPGREPASKSAVLFALILHFGRWAIAGFAWLYLLADVRATAADTTGPGAAGIVSGNGTQRQ